MKIANRHSTKAYWKGGKAGGGSVERDMSADHLSGYADSTRSDAVKFTNVNPAAVPTNVMESHEDYKGLKLPKKGQ